PAVEESDGSPRLRLVEPVQSVARGDARLAAAARVEIHLEGVLLTGRGRARGQELPVDSCFEIGRRGVVPRREALDGREVALFGERTLEERDGVRLGLVLEGEAG